LKQVLKLNNREFIEVLQNLKVILLKKGDNLFRQNDIGKWAYILMNGEIEFIKEIPVVMDGKGNPIDKSLTPEIVQ
jgi:CRP-like cAMP-binding protein